jgi:hypothetical protein
MKRSDLKEYDEDFEEELFPLLQEDKLEIVSTSEVEKFSDFITNNFPYRLGRVQFNIKDLVLSKSDFIGGSEQEWIDAIKEKLIYLGKEFEIMDSEFVLIGDNEILNSYKFIFKDFLEYFWIFLSIPQHTYLISKDGKYLISYTFEDDLYFAIKK